MSENERAHFKIALPIDLKKRLEHQAVDARRSLSAEIIARLENSFEAAIDKQDYDYTRLELERMRKEMAALADSYSVLSRFISEKANETK